MKSAILLSALLASASLLRANPEIATVIDQEYGAATAEGIVLLQSSASVGDPEQWIVYARDPFRQGELVRARLTVENRNWTSKPDGTGSRLLSRVPPQAIAFNRLKYRSSDARKVAQQTAALAKTNFITVEYQLAINASTGVPEWGLALNDTTGAEVGFVVVSAETGAVIHQQWSSGLGSNLSNSPAPGTKGERAAQEVKKSARRAWEWTGDAGVETGRFFKKLFSRD